MRRFDMDLKTFFAASADGFHRVAIDGHIFLNADRADQADENPDQNFRSVPSFSCSSSCGSCGSWFRLSKKINHETHEPHEKEHETRISSLFQIRTNPPDPRSKTPVSVNRYAMKTANAI